MSETATPADSRPKDPGKKKHDRTHYLYVAVVVAVVAGILVGWLAPEVGKSMAVLGTTFLALIKMIVPPIIFCTIVTGVGSVRKAASVGKIGVVAMVYFLVMSTLAMAIGLLVGNWLQPGSGLNVTPSTAQAAADLAGSSAGGTAEFIKSIIPTTMLSSLTSGNIMQTLFVALLVGFAVQSLGKHGEPVLRGVGHIQKVVFKIMMWILWLSPIGAFGAIANVVAQTGLGAVLELGTLMLAFYITCIVFVFGILGALLRGVAGVSIFKFVRYLSREFLLIFATSSSESGLPRLLAKMEHLGVKRSTVGIVVPTGYSFNLDGTAIYLTMAALFVGEALNKPLSLGEQISMLLFMLVASKGTAAVSGASLATFAAGIQAHRPDLLDGVGLIVGIDRFMSEARALTNFAGNAVATVLIGVWSDTIDREQMRRTLNGESPFDEDTLGDELSSNHGVPENGADDKVDGASVDRDESTPPVVRP
jgi:aerobic C4-dicarboxylate transport protein